VPAGIAARFDSVMVQKLGVSPVYWLHSLEIFSGCIAGVADATEVSARMAPAERINNLLIAHSLWSN
jgi:hypothetical protein